VVVAVVVVVTAAVPVASATNQSADRNPLRLAFGCYKPIKTEGVDENQRLFAFTPANQ